MRPWQKWFTEKNNREPPSRSISLIRFSTQKKKNSRIFWRGSNENRHVNWMYFFTRPMKKNLREQIVLNAPTAAKPPRRFFIKKTSNGLRNIYAWNPEISLKPIYVLMKTKIMCWKNRLVLFLATTTTAPSTKNGQPLAENIRTPTGKTCTRCSTSPIKTLRCVRRSSELSRLCKLKYKGKLRRRQRYR